MAKEKQDSQQKGGDLNIFVVGYSRSGTTMLGRILGRHPRIFMFHELHFFGQLWSPSDEDRRLTFREAHSLLKKLLVIQRDGYLRSGKTDRYTEEASQILKKIPGKGQWHSVDIFRAFLTSETLRSCKVYPCDQTPRNVYYIKEILLMIPGARIINIVRDPRDVLLSQKRKWKRRFLGGTNIPLGEALRTWVNYHPITISKMWDAAVRSAQLFGGDERVYQIRFEDLIEIPEKVISSLCHFLGINYKDDMLDIPQVGSSSMIDSPARKGINKYAAGRWRQGGLSKTEIFLCNKITQRSMELNNYEISPVKAPLAGVCFSYLFFPFKLGIAFLLNIPRMRNISDSIKRHFC